MDYLETLIYIFLLFVAELELLFVALLLVIVAPYQVMNLRLVKISTKDFVLHHSFMETKSMSLLIVSGRGKQEGVIIAFVIAAYLAFQHFLRAGSLRRAFDQGSVIASLAIICIVAVPCLLLI